MWPMNGMAVYAKFITINTFPIPITSLLLVENVVSLKIDSLKNVCMSLNLNLGATS